MECHADIVAPQKWDFRFAPTCKNTVTSGEDKLLLVWADDRNGDFDIYGMLMDSLVAVEEKERFFADTQNDRLEVYPNPFT